MFDGSHREIAAGWSHFFDHRQRLRINANLYRKLPYNPERDFAPVSLVGYGGYVLVVHPSLVVRSARIRYE